MVHNCLQLTTLWIIFYMSIAVRPWHSHQCKQVRWFYLIDEDISCFAQPRREKIDWCIPSYTLRSRRHFSSLHFSTWSPLVLAWHKQVYGPNSKWLTYQTVSLAGQVMQIQTWNITSLANGHISDPISHFYMICIADFPLSRVPNLRLVISEMTWFTTHIFPHWCRIIHFMPTCNS